MKGEKIEAKWKVIIVFTIVWAVAIILYLISSIRSAEKNNAYFDIINYIAMSITAYGVLFGAIITSFNTLENSKNVKENYRYNKINNSFNYMQRFDAPSIKEARDITRDLKKRKRKISDEELIKMIEGGEEDSREQKDLKRSVITMFNFFEEIYLAIKNNYADESILFIVYSDMYIDIYERFKCWLENDKYMGKIQTENLKELKMQWERKKS